MRIDGGSVGIVQERDRLKAENDRLQIALRNNESHLDGLEADRDRLQLEVDTRRHLQHAPWEAHERAELMGDRLAVAVRLLDAIYRDGGAVVPGLLLEIERFLEAASQVLHKAWEKERSA